MASNVSKNEVENIIKLWGAHRYASASDIACLTNPYRSPPTCKRIYPWPKYNGLKLKQSQIVNACLAHPDKTAAWIATEMGHGDRTVVNAVSKAIVLGHMDQGDILVQDGATVAKPKSESIATGIKHTPDGLYGDAIDGADIYASEIEQMMYPGTSTVGTEGRHDDEGKARYDLIAPELLDQVAQVLEYGAGKYEDRDWEKGSRWGRHFANVLNFILTYITRHYLSPSNVYMFTPNPQ